LRTFLVVEEFEAFVKGFLTTKVAKDAKKHVSFVFIAFFVVDHASWS